jgi:hypothetical protein
MYISYENLEATTIVQDVTALDVPVDATHAEIQAEVQNVRYTMDNLTNPSNHSGMILLTTEPPRLFDIEDVKRIKFISDDVATSGRLNIHYYQAGRDI